MRPLSHLADTLADLGALNNWCGDQALRRYQKDLLTHGSLTVRAPDTGQRHSATAHYAAPLEGCLYWFSADTPFAVATGSLHLGNPITHLITATGIHGVAGPKASPLADRAQKLLHTGTEPDQAITPSAQPIALLGHPNFAHYVWNEFPALWHLNTAAPAAQIRMLYDPLGVTGAWCSQAGLTYQAMDNLAAARGWQAAPTCMIGATRCGAAAKDALLHLMGLAPDYAPQPQPCLYLSVRKVGRTIENQRPLLSRFAHTALSAWPDLTLVFDGFSLPVDFDRSIYHPQRATFERRITEARDVVSEITSDLPVSMRHRIHDITGARLDDALQEIRRCQYYITHPGTQQHKAAWFYPLTGVMHGNLASVSPGSLAWHGSQVAGSLAPDGLPASLIDDVATQDMHVANARNCNYRVTDLEKAVAHLMARVKALLD
ncbi:MAG: hypothetical protein AAF748_09750 [Pseudomonadota bacterium]